MSLRAVCRLISVLVLVQLPLCAEDASQHVPVAQILNQVIESSSLTAPGSPPFYLKAKIDEPKHPDSNLSGEVEEYWASPTKWRRSIRTKAFSQTLIVNDGKVYEENSGDYFPAALEMLVTSIVDPIPQWAADQLRKVDFKIVAPNGKSGQCKADTYVTMKERYILSLDCRTGLLEYVNIPGWDAGVYDDYRRFHNKMIAFRTQDQSLVMHIDALSDLGTAQESRFTIDQSTPATDRIHTVYVPESEYRKFIANAPEIKWPQVAAKPDSGSVRVNIEVDRSGRVRRANSFVSSNPEVKEFAVEQVRNWQFKPYLVDGVPVQVETALFVDFKTELKPDPARSPTAKEFFDHARGLSESRVEGGKPFRLKAEFEAFGEANSAGKGTYEETWVSPTQWRREATLNGKTVIETRNGDLRYRRFEELFAPRRLDDVIDVFGIVLPGGDSGYYRDSEWKVANSRLGNVPLVRVSRGLIDGSDEPNRVTTLYYFSPLNGLLRAHYQGSRTTTYNDFQDFMGKALARRVATVEDGAKILDIAIVSLEPAQSQPEAFFVLDGVKPWSVADDEASGYRTTFPRAIKQVKPLYPEAAHRLNLHERVVAIAWVDAHGHVRAVEFQGDSNDLLKAAVRQALMQWEFVPGTWKGRPGEFGQSFAFQF